MHRCFNLLRPPEATLLLEHHILAFPLFRIFYFEKTLFKGDTYFSCHPDYLNKDEVSTVIFSNREQDIVMFR